MTEVYPDFSIPPATLLVWRAFPGDAPVSIEDGSVTLMCVGDVMFGRRIEEIRKQVDIPDPFVGMRSVLTSGDMAVGNLECVLGTPEEFASWKSRDKILLSSPKPSAHELKYAGFRLLSLGNNHSLDYREEGLFSTISILKDEGLGWVGLWEGEAKPTEPWITVIRGIRVAFLGFSDVSPPIFRACGAGHPGTIPPLPELIRRDISYAKTKADFVVVQAHWGIEYQGEPSDRQKSLAHQMVDAGADAVVGHHPHVLQGVERYKGKFIIYSLGNFMFDLKRPISHPGMVLRLRLEKGKLPAADYILSWGGDMFPRPPSKSEEEMFPAWLRMVPQVEGHAKNP